MINEDNRVRWIKSKLNKQHKGLKIIDVGAGECQYKKYCSHLKYTSQDINHYDPSKNKIGLQMHSWDNTSIDIISDITKIPVKKSSYDIVLCTEVLEHILNPEKAIKEMSRITKKNGVLILTAPFCSLTHFSPYHYSTGFNKYYYIEILRKYGYKILEIDPNGNYFLYLEQELLRSSWVVQRYVNVILGKVLFPIFIAISLIFKLLSKFDSNSSELLTFGYHIYARKVGS